MKSTFKDLLKEPLLHFMIVGLILFLAFEFAAQEEVINEDDRIIVDRESLITFMQYRSKVFERERIEQALDGLSEDELQSLIDDYVKEEALYREAKALNLDKNDYSSRQRLIRQLEFINQGFLSATISLTEEDLRLFLDANPDRYYEPGTITFTHVFYNTDRHGAEKALALAKEKLLELDEYNVQFHQALSHGDRFLYHRNYVNKNTEEIGSHFGEEMQESVFALDADDQRWNGPFQSEYGYHLVMVTRKIEGYLPPLEEILPRVEQDTAQARLNEELDKINQAIVDAYEVDVVGLTNEED